MKIFRNIRGEYMKEIIFVVIILVVWFLVTQVIFPRLGIPT